MSFIYSQFSLKKIPILFLNHYHISSKRNFIIIQKTYLQQIHKMENTQKRRKISSESYLSQNNEAVKVTGLPERFQLRPNIVADRKLTIEEINLATETITKFFADYHEIPITSQLSDAIKNTLTFFSQDFVEVPYIWTYKSDFIANLSRANLWQIFDFEYEFRKFVEMKDQVLSDITKNNFQDPYINKMLSEVKNFDEIYNLSIFIKFQEKKISPSEYLHELRRKGLLPKGRYLEYILKGLCNIVDEFGVQIPLFVQNLYLETKNYQPKNNDLSPLQTVKQLYPESKDPGELLKQTIELFAYEISVDPNFRKFIRNYYIQHGFLVTSGPLINISADNECWTYCFWKIKIQKAFNIGDDCAQLLYYKSQNLIDITFQLHNEEQLLEVLKNNIINDAPVSSSHIQWNEYRTYAVVKAYNDILKANTESWLTAKFEANAEQLVMEQCMLNLERKINVKPFRTSEMDRNANAIPRVFALSCGASDENATCCVYINEDGKKIQEWFWSTIKIFDSKEGKEFLDALNKFKPHIVVVQCYNFKTKFLFRYVKDFVYHYYNEKQSEKTIVIVEDDKVAMEYISEFSNTSELSRYCTSLARMIQNPLMEHLRIGDKIMNIKFHPLQPLLPKEKLKKALDRAFINIINEIGVDINDILNNEFNEPKQKTLHYICGLGPQNSTCLKRLIFGKEYNPKFNPFIDTRSKLKNYLEPKIFQNSVGFLKICPKPIEPLDNSRIHPDFYDLAHKNISDMNDMHPLLMQLISEEHSNPFIDKRLNYEIPDSGQVFAMVTRTRSGLHSGLIISVIVKNIDADGLTVCIENSDFECYIGWNDIDKNVNIGDTLNALVKYINNEKFTVRLSCIQEDLKRGQTYRSSYEKKFDEFIDIEAKRSYQLPVKVEEPKLRLLRTINHPCFERATVQEAERMLSMQPYGSYIIRPTTTDPNKLSITWKIYSQVYRHLQIVESNDKKFLVEGEDEVYETLDELLATYIQKTNDFIDKLINHQNFRSEEQLDEFLENYLQNNPYTAYGFYINNTYPGTFICGFKFRPGEQMLKMRGFFRPYGFRIENSRFHNINELINGVKKKMHKEYAEF